MGRPFADAHGGSEATRQPVRGAGGEEHVGQQHARARRGPPRSDADVVAVDRAKLAVQPEPVAQDDIEDVAPLGLVRGRRLDQQRHATFRYSASSLLSSASQL